VRKAIYTDPDDQSAWLYQRWLLGRDDLQLKIVDAFIINENEVMIVFNIPVSVSPFYLNIQLTGEENITSDGERISSISCVGAFKYTFVHVLKSSTSIVEKFKKINIPAKAYHSHFDKNGDVKYLSREVSIEFLDGIGKIDVSEDKPSGQHYLDLNIWKKEAESVRELVELEPDSKWALITLVYLMRDIVSREGGSYDEVIGWIVKLGEIDGGRKGYYDDLRSEVVWDSLARSFQGGVIDASNLCITRLPLMLLTPSSSRLALITSLDLSGNMLGPLLFPRTRKMNEKEETKPVFPMLRRLIASGNKIVRIASQISEYCGKGELERVDLRGNLGLLDIEDDLRKVISANAVLLVS
jgi:geranylgeranyl transferase type-2 subunit alpha